MRVNQLRLRNFRNYEQLDFDSSASHIAFSGENGSGKTNLLEAIYLSSITRSFRTSNIRQMVRFEENEALVEIQWESAVRGKLTSRWVWQAGQKQFFLNQEPVENATDYFGHLPVVALVPEDVALTREGPAHRRRFLDMIMSQQSSLHLDLLKRYHHLLKIRNRLLRDIREGIQPRTALDPWQEPFLSAGREIIQRRRIFIESFCRQFQESMRALAMDQHQFELHYRPDTDRDKLEAVLESGLIRDLDTQTTRHGPHRDDLQILLDGHDLRYFGSQGQHKLVLIGLKLAEVQEIQSHRGEMPLLLLDDLFSELDGKKISGICQALPRDIQTWVTSTQVDHFRYYFPDQLQLLHVEQGRVEAV